MASLPQPTLVLNTTRSLFVETLLLVGHDVDPPGGGARAWPAPVSEGVGFYATEVEARFGHRWSPPPKLVIAFVVIEPSPGSVLVTAHCHDEQYAAAFAELLAWVGRAYPDLEDAAPTGKPSLPTPRGRPKGRATGYTDAEVDEIAERAMKSRRSGTSWKVIGELEGLDPRTVQKYIRDSEERRNNK